MYHHGIMKLTIATCQFPVDSDIHRNLRYVLRQLNQAKQRRADVVHFSELCLSGYAGVEFKSYKNFDWSGLSEATECVLAEAKKLKLWVILGSSHRLGSKHKPHNSLYIINNRGSIIDRYDKMFCTGPRDERSGDLKHYTPGNHLPVFTIGGVRCGVQICHDFRYQEIYRELKKKRVQLVFHSYHNGHHPQATLDRSGNIWGVIVPPTMQAYAANNHMWISANNTIARCSSWPSFFVQPDGVITDKLRNHSAGVLISRIDTSKKFYDASEQWRDRAMKGVLHSGKLVSDPRSRDRKSY
jgi:predicted amidohydrolase